MKNIGEEHAKMKRLIGLIAIAIGVIMVITLFPTLVDNFKLAWEGSQGVWTQIKSVVSVLWSFVFQPLVLILLGFIALDEK